MGVILEKLRSRKGQDQRLNVPKRIPKILKVKNDLTKCNIANATPCTLGCLKIFGFQMGYLKMCKEASTGPQIF